MCVYIYICTSCMIIIHTWTFHCCVNLCHERKSSGQLFSPNDPKCARSPEKHSFHEHELLAKYQLLRVWDLRSFCGYLRPFCGYVSTCIYERSRRNSQKCSNPNWCPFPRKKNTHTDPTSKFLLRNTQGAHIYVTNEGPGTYVKYNFSTSIHKRKWSMILTHVQFCGYTWSTW